MINVQDKSQCCGCTACKSVCSRQAITMEPDALGFLYPKVDLGKCVDCGLCERACAFTQERDLPKDGEYPICYAARHKNIEDVKLSRSGAAFIAFSDRILADDGAVYGASFDLDLVVRHSRATTKQERDAFRGSKYVQSDLGDAFASVKKDLACGKPVLFSGTACQVSGLKSFIPKSLQEKLYTLGVICHGVPSPFLFRDYLSYTEKKHKKKVVSFNFRDKSLNGWSDHIESMVLSDGERVSSTVFTHLFYRNNALRECCYKCPYANTNRVEDITIGDFWGYENVVPDFNQDNRGCSLVLINSHKGKSLFEQSSEDLVCANVPLEKCLQRNLVHPTPRPDDRVSFEKGYARSGFKFVEKKYITLPLLKRIKRKLIGYGRKLFKKN